MTEPKNRKEKRAHERLRNQEEADLRFVMGSVEGRRLMVRLWEISGTERCSMAGNSWTFFNEGLRFVGNEFKKDAEEFCPELYLLAKKEAKERLKVDKQIRESLNPAPEKEDEDA